MSNKMKERGLFFRCQFITSTLIEVIVNTFVNPRNGTADEFDYGKSHLI